MGVLLFELLVNIPASTWFEYLIIAGSTVIDPDVLFRQPGSSQLQQVMEPTGVG